MLLEKEFILVLDGKTSKLIQVHQEDYSADFSFPLLENYYSDEKIGQFVKIEKNCIMFTVLHNVYGKF